MAVVNGLITGSCAVYPLGTDVLCQLLVSLLRAGAGFYFTAPWLMELLMLSGILWAACFAVYLFMT
jgi:hypothetical protein